jgi:hypothetical protein
MIDDRTISLSCLLYKAGKPWNKYPRTNAEYQHHGKQWEVTEKRNI